MTMIFTNPQTKVEIKVVVVKLYSSVEPMFLVHKFGATSAKYVFGVRRADCRSAC